MTDDHLDELSSRVGTLVDRVTALAADIAPGEPLGLGDLLERLGRRDLTVVVVGERNRGKSALINALVGDGLLPAAATTATTVPVILRYADGPPTAVAFLATEDGVEARTIDPAVLDQWVVDDRTGRTTLIVLTVASPLLAQGLELVDTPGVGGVEAADRAQTLTALRRGDAALFVTDAHQPVSDSELDFLGEVAALTDRVVFAVNKIDARADADWQAIFDQNERLIKGREPRFAVAPFVPVSALELGSPGIDALRATLRDRVLRDGIRARLRSTVTRCAALLRGWDVSRVPPGPHSREQMAEAATALDRDAVWRLKLHDRLRDLQADIDRIATAELDQRLRRVRTAAARRVALDSLRAQARDELTTVAVILAGRAEDGLSKIAAGLPASGLPSGYGAPPTVADLRSRLSPEAVNRAGAEVLDGLFSGVQLGAKAVPLVRQVLSQVARKAPAAVGAGAAAGVTTAAAGGGAAVGAEAGAAVAATTGVAAAATVVGLVVAVVVVGVFAYRAYHRLQEAQADEIQALAEHAGTDQTKRVQQDVATAAERLERLVETDLRGHAERLKAREENHERQAGQAGALRDLHAMCTRLLADIGPADA